MNLFGVILALSLNIVLTTCDDKIMRKYQKCHDNRILIFNDYYIQTEPIPVPILPRIVWLEAAKIKYNNDVLVHQNNVTVENHNFFNKNGKLFVKINGNSQIIEVFERAGESVEAFVLDKQRNIIFALTKKGRKRTKNLYAVKLQDITEFKNVCPWRHVKSKHYLSININEETGELLFGYMEKKKGYIEVLKPTNLDNCQDFDISDITKDFEIIMNTVKTEIEFNMNAGIAKNKTMQGLNGLLALHKMWLTDILIDKQNNETYQQNRNLELEQKIENDKNNRITMGVQISFLVEGFQDIPMNLSQSFPSKRPFHSINHLHGSNYECALKSDFEGNLELGEMLDNTNKDMLENLQALQNEVIKPEELGEFASFKQTDDELIDDIFG